MKELFPSLKGLNGGLKMKWLRDNRPEVLAYYDANGEAATRERYNIKKDDTWSRLLNPSTQHPHNGFTKVDRALARAEIAEEAARQANRRTKELEGLFRQFIPLLADEITRKFFIPLLSGKVELPAALEYKPEPDKASLADFNGKLEKRGKSRKSICYVTKEHK